MEEFLRWLFDDVVSADHQLALFTVPEKRTRFFAEIPDAAQVARNLAQSQNVYFGVGLIRGQPKGRGKQKDVGGIGALWADIDFAGVAHNGKPLPQSDADLDRILKQLPLPPSIIVDSGHGRHLYWLLHEPWLFNDDEERRRAATLTHGWHGLICAVAGGMGWSLENLGDLTRILRLPETVNRKQADGPITVRVFEADPSRRYAAEDFENFLPEPEVKQPKRPCTSCAVAAPNVDLDARPPADKFQSAMDESPAFRQAWERCRPDLTDQSASAYDLSLATLAAIRGWSDDEIGRLIVARRIEHAERPKKALRADYLSRTIGRARSAAAADESTVDLSQFLTSAPRTLTDTPPQTDYPDPGPLPESLCRVPGFVAGVMDHCLSTAPYPNVPLAFCGALALQAVLAGRKMRDEADNRTNIYLLALAFSSVGKDWPRKVNTAILHRVGLVNVLGEKFASGEGIQDALNLDPAMLFQTDEVDGLLQSINKSRDARHENILGTLLTMYSSANSIYPMRRKAGKEPPGVIDQPCLVVYGTAIPTHYYGALSERMLTNGFFARMLIVESSPRSVGQDPGIIDPPEHLIDAAQWWADFRPGTGNLENWHPQPKVVPATEAARSLLRESRVQAESEYSASEARGDPVGTTVWGRVHEQTRKLALLYAVSENHTDPVIDTPAVAWATEFVMHQTRRMLFMAHGHVAENPFHAECLKLMKKLREAPEQTLPHSVLLKRMKLDAKTFQGLIETLAQQGDVEIQAVKTTGRTGIHYRLLGERTVDGETSDAPEAAGVGEEGA